MIELEGKGIRKEKEYNGVWLRWRKGKRNRNSERIKGVAKHAGDFIPSQPSSISKK